MPLRSRSKSKQRTRTRTCSPSPSPSTSTSMVPKTQQTPHTPAGSRPNIKQNIRQLVWNRHVGEQYGRTQCHCCNATTITPFLFECGHVQARAKGGLDSVDNLRPICGLCNRSMGTMNMFQFQKIHNLPVKPKFYYFKTTFISITIMAMVALVYLIYYYYLNFDKRHNYLDFKSISNWY